MTQFSSPLISADNTPTTERDLWIFPTFFLANWEEPVVVANSYRTDIAKTSNGGETRWGLLNKPYRTQTIASVALRRMQVQALDAMMMRMSRSRSVMPLMSDVTKLDVTAAAGTNVLTCDLRYRRFSGCTRVLIAAKAVHYDLIEPAVVQSVDVGTGQITLASNLAATWPAGSRVFPLFESELVPDPSAIVLNDAVGRITIASDETPGRTALPPTVNAGAIPTGTQTYDGLPIFDFTFDTTAEVNAGVSRYIRAADVGLGSSMDAHGPRGSRTRAGELLFLRREKAWRLVQFFDSRVGAMLPFWSVGPWGEFTVRQVTTNTVTVEQSWSVRDWDDRPHIYFRLRDGTILIREITGVVRGGGVDVVTVDEALPAFSLPQLRACGIASMCRFGSDEMQERWITPEVMRTRVELVEVLNEQSIELDDLIPLTIGDPGTGPIDRMRIDPLCECPDLCVIKEEQLGSPGGATITTGLCTVSESIVTDVPDKVAVVMQPCDFRGGGTGGDTPDYWVQAVRCFDQVLVDLWASEQQAAAWGTIYQDGECYDFSGPLSPTHGTLADPEITGLNCDSIECRKFVQLQQCGETEVANIWIDVDDLPDPGDVVFYLGLCYEPIGDPVPYPELPESFVIIASESVLTRSSCEHPDCDPPECETCTRCTDDEAPPTMTVTLSGFDGESDGPCTPSFGCFTGPAGNRYILGNIGGEVEQLKVEMEGIDGTYEIPYTAQETINSACGSTCYWQQQISGSTVRVVQRGANGCAGGSIGLAAIPAVVGIYRVTANDYLVVVSASGSNSQGWQGIIYYRWFTGVGCKTSFGDAGSGSLTGVCAGPFDTTYLCDPDYSGDVDVWVDDRGSVSVTPGVCQ